MSLYQIGRFEGKSQIAQMEDPHRGRTMRAFYIGSDTLVGINDGIDAWILQIGSGCHAMQLEKRMAEFKAGTLPAVRSRRRVVEDDEPDRFCITTEDGGCISEDPRCMHNKQAAVDEGGVGIRRCPRRRIHVD